MEAKLGVIEGLETAHIRRGFWLLDDVDFALIAMLSDPIYGPELLWGDPNNAEYGGCYRVRDYQYPLNRYSSNYKGHQTARSVGKTESIKAKAFTHAFRRTGQGLLLTAPELIHLLPLTDAVESRIRDCRLTRELLDARAGKTGFTHRPFGVNYIDGTQIIGRIPRLSGPQPLYAKVLTPHGWTTMGEIAAGDEVIGSDGLATRVLGVTNSWESDIWRVKFTDGSEVDTDGRHLWLVEAQEVPYQLVDTNDLRAALLMPPKRRGGSLNMFRVPPSPKVHFAEMSSQAPIDPYVIGALLGDGAISGKTARIICTDEQIITEIRNRLPEGCRIELYGKRGCEYKINAGGRGTINPLMAGLRELGLVGHTAHTKFIPDRYKYGSIEERVDVLRGLLDTDGTVRDSGAASLILASRKLVEDAAEIVRSLGGWASSGAATVAPSGSIVAGGKTYSFPGGTYYRATLRLKGTNLFYLDRKAIKYKIDGRIRHKSIRDVVPAGRAPVRCITVEAEDGLYLTDGYVVTHNTGVKGQHVPELIIDEAQDYPERGWTEVHEVSLKDVVDSNGKPDFHYEFYGVHSGARNTRFYHLGQQGAFEIVQVTAIQRPGWNDAEKQAAKAMYGGTSSPDYRRNILGEPGAAASSFFVVARLADCTDQDRESDYNTLEYKHIELQAEEFDALSLPMHDTLDLPDGYQSVWAGADLGLTNSPTVITIFGQIRDSRKRLRLKLLRRITLHRFRPRHIVEAWLAVGAHFGGALKGFGVDSTGLGFPIVQAMEDDQAATPHLAEVTRGYFFNAKVPVHVKPENITTGQDGQLRDQYGAAVKEEIDPITGSRRYVTYMPMIEASTRYLRTYVDSSGTEGVPKILLPFDVDIHRDMMGETTQRLRQAGELRRKPNMFHILDSMRAMAMAMEREEIEEQMMPELPAVLDQIPGMDLAGGGVMIGQQLGEF